VARYSDLESGEIEAVYWRHPSRDETALMVAKAREEAIIGIRI